MSQGNESSLRFSLEESVWFQKGQEVEELISISLDPNITIHENDQYVTIEGSLRLKGEYKRHDVEIIEDDFSVSPKFIQQVEDRGEGVCEFSHDFPIDITIPNNRIQSIYEIDVEVNSFDYVLPERSCMKLSADLTITGLYGEQQHAPAEDDIEVEEEEEELELAYRSPFEGNQAEKEVEISEIPIEINRAEDDVPSVEDIYTPFEVEARKSPVQQELNENLQKTLSIEKEKITAPEISFLPQREEVKIPSEEVEEIEEPEEKEPINENIPIEEESEAEPEPAPKKKKKSKKDGMSLTEFLARKEDDEELVKLKVCIVQSGDTIDVLAERYEVSAQQLLRVNQLELNQDVYEGQVLYIPPAVVRR